MKHSLALLFALAPSLIVVPGAAAAEAGQTRAALFPLKHSGPLTNPYESLVIGNGDLAVSAQIFSHELVLNLGKNDVWDSRIDSSAEETAMKHDELIRANGDARGLRGNSNTELVSTDYVNKSRLGPTPKRVGFLRVLHPGLSDTKITSQVNIADGILTVDYGFMEGHLLIETFVHREKNCVFMKLTAQGKIPWLNVIMEKPPDYTDSGIPFPVVTARGDSRQAALSQTIPGKFDVPDFTWTMAAAFPGRESRRASNVIQWPYALKQEIYLADGESVVVSAGVATDRDGSGNTLARAFELAGAANWKRFESERAAHLKAWATFWAASSIELEDKELEAMWYRSMFGFACHLNPGAQAPGLNANIPMYDYSAWNGFYTWNHNVQKWYFPALAVNHTEWYEPFASLIQQHIPVFEHLAKVNFNLEGVYVDLMTAPFAPPHRAKTHSINGRALAHTGWLASMLFSHYEYTGDKQWLAKRAYPFIQKAAEFYSNYLDKYQKQDGDIYPSMLLEDTSRWSPGFARSRNVVTDLVMFKKAFETAISSAEILGVDQNLRKRWAEHAKRVPPIDYGWKDGKAWYALYKDWNQVWPDFDQYLKHLRESRWGSSGWIVFPGEFVNGDEKDGLAAAVREVVRHTDLLHLPAQTTSLGTFHGEANFLPFMRLGIMEKYDDLRTLLLYHRFASGQFSPYPASEGGYIRTGHTNSWRIVENQYMPILGIAEMLLQSQGSVIRLFPYWPKDKSASFKTLRARGGFLVSADRASSGFTKATITSLLGKPCRIRWTEPRKPVVSEGGKTIAYKVDGLDIVLDTKAGVSYELRSE